MSWRQPDKDQHSNGGIVMMGWNYGDGDGRMVVMVTVAPRL